MRIVSENSDNEIERNFALSQVAWAPRELTANLMRVTRGAGRPADIGQQAADLLGAMNAYRDAAGVYPSSDQISSALDLGEKEHWTEWEFAVRDMVKGGLQIAASSLLHQRAQIAAGESEMFDGLTVIEKIRERDSREHSARGRSKAKQVRSEDLD